VARAPFARHLRELAVPGVTGFQSLGENVPELRAERINMADAGVLGVMFCSAFF